MNKMQMMRRSLDRLMIASAALGLTCGAVAGTIGVNFQDSWGTTAADGGAAVTNTAFGVPASDWYNMTMVANSGSVPVSTNQTVTLPGGRTLNVAWSAKNTWSLYADLPTAGDDQVVYGYLDDSDYGYTVVVTGLRGLGTSVKVTTIASTDGGQSFPDALLTYGTTTENLQYLNNYMPTFATGLAGTSTVSTAISTVTGNDRIQIKGSPKADQARSTLAAFLLEFTPGDNAPLIEANPQAPATSLFEGDTLTLTAAASGTAPLYYQWRKAGTAIPGANSATYTKTVTATDGGSYDVVVTNALGSVTSLAAVVNVSVATQPAIVKGPQATRLFVGYPLSLKVEATGGELTYQWKKDNQNIPNATADTLVIDPVSLTNTGTYSVQVANRVGNATASALVEVVKPTAGSYEETMAGLRPLVWYRYSETEPRLVETGTAANSGSTGTAASGVAKYYVDMQQPGAIAGDANKAAGFAGGQAIDVPFNAALNTATFTVEVWAKPTVAGSGGAIAPLYNRGANLGDGWLFFANNGGNYWSFRTYSGTTRNNINSTTAVSTNEWTHLVGVYDGTTTRFWVNGVEQGTGVEGVYQANNAIPLRIGAAGNDHGRPSDLAWRGGLDEVALYDKVLTPAQIVAHYENGKNAARTQSYSDLVQASAPVAYYRLNDAPGATAPTPKNSGIAGADWNGIYGGDVTPVQVGPRPSAMPGFESTNTSVLMTNGWTTSKNLPIANNVTVVTWLKRQQPSTTGDLSWPAWLGGGGLHLNNGSAGTPAAELRYHWNGGEWGWSSGLFVQPDVWTFCAMVITPTGARFYMSEDGTLKSASRSVTHAPMAVTSPPGYGGFQPAWATRNYIGNMDETAVFDRALSHEEVSRLFVRAAALPFVIGMELGGIIEDTKPSGTPHHGYNSGATWLPSLADSNGTNRTGVMQFRTEALSQIRIPADADFNTTTGTISFWIRANSPIPGPGNEGAMIFDRRTTNGIVLVLADSGALFVQTVPGSINTFEAGVIADLSESWHHVAVTYDQTATGNITVYVDGSLMNSMPNNGTWSWPPTAQIELGRSHDGYWKRLNGQMDDFRMYSRILTEAEIGQVYRASAIVDPASLKLRFDFGNAGIGHSVSWPFGVLEQSTSLDPNATWTTVPSNSPYPFLPEGQSLFFRGKL